MFDIAWTEMALIAVVALIVIGPKDLPKVMRTVGLWTRKIRTMAGDFQRGVDQLARESELDELRQQMRDAVPSVNKLETMLNKAAMPSSSPTPPPQLSPPLSQPSPEAAPSLSPDANAPSPFGAELAKAEASPPPAVAPIVETPPADNKAAHSAETKS